ncbi:MAG: hypothetical protein AABZ60_04705 [Planctomycetota bacterium]
MKIIFFSVLLVGIGFAWIGTRSLWAQEDLQYSQESEMWHHKQASQMIFFAVLEGLYQDGVSNEIVDLIIPPQANSEYPKLEESFIYTCELCHPAYEAFRLYRSRPNFYPLYKGATATNTFGAGLSTEILKQFQSNVPEIRRKALQDLIQKWIHQSLEKMRFSEEEKYKWSQQFERMKKDAAGKGLQLPNYSKWQSCPTCEGTTKAAE